MLTRGAVLPRRRSLPGPGGFGRVASSMPLGVISGRPLRPFSSRNLVTLLRHHPLQLRDFAEQLDNQSFDFGPRKLREIARRRQARSESYFTASGESPKCPSPEVLPRLPSTLLRPWGRESNWANQGNEHAA